MPIRGGKRRGRKRDAGKTLGTLMDRNERFALSQGAVYVKRHLARYPVLDLETLELMCQVLGQDRGKLADILLESVSEDVREDVVEDLEEVFHEPDDYARILWRALGKSRASLHKGFVRKGILALDQRMDALGLTGRSDLEKNLLAVKGMFGLNAQESEFCTFLYLLSYFEPFEHFFVNHLKCQKFSGRRYLLNALGLSSSQLDEILNGKLERIGLFEMDDFDLSLEKRFRTLVENPSHRLISRNFYERLPGTHVPLEHHFVGQKEMSLCLALLRKRPDTSTHILLYGPPGTGKSSFAAGMARELKTPAYSIVKGEANTTVTRRAAILACINMTNAGKGSLIVVDEADNLLNTQYSWFMRGETQDKGWLNELLEEPGLRMIWITNRIEDIEESVLRRFAFSLHFKAFNKRQRIELWKNICRNNRASRFLGKDQVQELARDYQVSAGAMDLAVKKAWESGASTRRAFVEAVELALDAHETLMNDGEKLVDRERIEKAYSLEGLSIEGNLEGLIKQLETFDHFLREGPQDEILNLDLLFHGPPGTGKSELARYIGERLDREILCRRMSDIHSKWVGESEKNIREAFEEAEREEAILVMDEADSLLFSRDRAQRSWEISLTNEFLTSMERFRGILICTSNRLRDLDGASIRRFNHKLGFGHLTREGNGIFYRKLLSPLQSKPLDPGSQTALMAITNLTPGDFKTVRDRFAFYPKKERSHHQMVAALAEEANIKRLHSGDKAIGF